MIIMKGMLVYTSNRANLFESESSCSLFKSQKRLEGN